MGAKLALVIDREIMIPGYELMYWCWLMSIKHVWKLELQFHGCTIQLCNRNK